MMRLIFIFFFLGVSSSFTHASEMFADSFQQDAYGNISASGHIHLKSPNYELKADALEFDVDSKSASMQGASVHFDEGYTLKGDSLKRIDLKSFRGKNVEYSTCPVDDWAWSIVAEEAELDHDKGEFRAKHAWFELGGVPVLYTPYWRHALTRRSGLLMPEISSSTVRGSELTVPYYWAGAPNWDVTLRPRWMSYRGFMSDVEWRHRSSSSTEVIQVQSIFDDKTQTQRGRIMSHVTWRASQTVRVKLDVDAVRMDDGLYIADYPMKFEKESKAYLTSSASVGWQEGRDSAVLSSRYQQRLGGTSNDTTLQILPRLDTNHYFNLDVGEGIRIVHQTTEFQRGIGSSGLRSGIRPSLTIPWYMQGGAISATWTLNGQAVAYDAKQSSSQKSSYGAVASSAQLQAVFERISNSGQWRHELKPMIRLDVSSASNQADVPLYDSRLIPLSMSNILSGNRYSGWDRFEKMRRLSMLLVSSLQKKDEPSDVRTVLQGQVGIVWDDLLETVDETIAPASTRNFSNTLAEVSWFPSRRTRLSTGGQYDPDVHEWVEAHAIASWAGDTKEHVNISWQRTRASHSVAGESLRASVRARLSSRWASYGSTQYDLLRGYALNTIVGVAYEHACWGGSFEGFRTHQVGTDNVEDVGARVLLVFDGLGSFGGG